MVSTGWDIRYSSGGKAPRRAPAPPGALPAIWRKDESRMRLRRRPPEPIARLRIRGIRGTTLLRTPPRGEIRAQNAVTGEPGFHYRPGAGPGSSQKRLRSGFQRCRDRTLPASGLPLCRRDDAPTLLHQGLSIQYASPEKLRQAPPRVGFRPGRAEGASLPASAIPPTIIPMLTIWTTLGASPRKIQATKPLHTGRV